MNKGGSRNIYNYPIDMNEGGKCVWWVTGEKTDKPMRELSIIYIHTYVYEKHTKEGLQRGKARVAR